MKVVTIFIMLFISSASQAAYKLKESEYGWRLYYDSRADVYLQLVDLRKATLRMACTQYTFDCSHKELNDHWDAISRKPYSITNGQFFRRRSGDTQLTLPVASYGGNFIANGLRQYDPVYEGYIRTLQIKESSAMVLSYYYPFLLSSSYNGGIVGLAPFEDGTSNGRTMIGLYNNYTLIILSAEKMKEIDAVNILFSLNISERNIVILDGSGSSQLKTESTEFYGCVDLPGICFKDKRTFPQYMLVESK